MALALSRNMMGAFLEFHPTVLHDLHESVPFLYVSTGMGPYNAWLDPLTIDEWQKMAYVDVEELTRRGVPGVWTHGYYDGWAPNYMFYVANGHNSIGRFYETFGAGGADTGERTVPANSTSRTWFRPNPPLLAGQLVAAQQRQSAGERHSDRHERRGHQSHAVPLEFLPEERAQREKGGRMKARWRG